MVLLSTQGQLWGETFSFSQGMNHNALGRALVTSHPPLLKQLTDLGWMADGQSYHCGMNCSMSYFKTMEGETTPSSVIFLWPTGNRNQPFGKGHVQFY